MTGSPDVYESNVHLFGVTSSPFCANFALRKTVSEFGSSMSPSTTLAVNECFYVDDCLLSCASVSETKGIVDDLRKLLAKGGFLILQVFLTLFQMVTAWGNTLI